MNDPFDTARLRASTLQTWASSPTRLREDTAVEADLARGGYRDRVLTELAQNAADAAARAQIAGALSVDLVGDELRVTNTGAPLDLLGVQALAALRASSKVDAVGRFGVGFTAVLAVSDAPRVLSRTGSIGFSAERTRAAVNLTGVVPVLRLVWPVAERPTADTDVVLPLRAGVDGAALLRGFAAQAPELLLELTALRTITVAGRRFERQETALGPGLSRVTVAGRVHVQSAGTRARWLARIADGGEVVAVTADVLRAPTRTDEELSLPALVVADVELAPDRRRIQPGAALAGLADGYCALVRALEPGQRTRLVPVPGFPRSAVDEALRAEVLAALRDDAWLPGADGGAVAPRAAVVLDPLAPQLTELLAEVVPGLVIAELSARTHASALAAVGVARLGLAGVAEAVAGLAREPAWWGRLYEALDPQGHDRLALEELAALPVPLLDGRTVLGSRGTVLAGTPVDVPGLRVVHPDAAHPLLERLGAVRAGPRELLEHPAVRAAVREGEPAETVLALVRDAGTRPGEHPWLGQLLLADDAGELRAADELLLPGAPLAALLVEDAPFGVVDAAVVAEYGADTLRAVGVGWGFTLLIDDDATGPDHELDDEDRWWAQYAPERVLAVRDLDLVDERAWPRALALLPAEAVRERDGYTAWWLRRHARLPDPAGALRPLGHFRAADDQRFVGLLDVAPGLPATVVAAEIDPELAELLLERLGDPARAPSVGVVARTHAALAHLDPTTLDPPERVRARDGSVIRAERALVLDGAWWAQVVPAGHQVLGGLGASGQALAELLDVAVVSEELAVTVPDAGTDVAWDTVPEVVLACAQLGVEVPGGTVRVHPRLEVTVDGVPQQVEWWVQGEVVHASAAGRLPALLHELAP